MASTFKGLYVEDIDRLKLSIYLQYRFPLSNYTENNFDLHNEVDMVKVTSPDNSKYFITRSFYDKCLQYNSVIEREKLINDILKD
jgi:hypothetical protein